MPPKLLAHEIANAIRQNRESIAERRKRHQATSFQQWKLQQFVNLGLRLDIGQRRKP